MIRRDTLVEDLVNAVPESIAYLMGRGIQAIACGAPIWGTLEEAARGRRYSDEEIDDMVEELRALAASPEHPTGSTPPA